MTTKSNEEWKILSPGAPYHARVRYRATMDGALLDESESVHSTAFAVTQLFKSDAKYESVDGRA